MTLKNPSLLSTIFMVETLYGVKRYSSGPMYKKSEIIKAKEILTNYGYTVHNHDNLENGIPVIMLVNPSPREDGNVSTAYIVLSNEESSLIPKGTDNSWAGGVVVKGYSKQGKGFEDFVPEETRMVWSFIKENKPSWYAPVSRCFSNLLGYSSNRLN